MFSDDQIRENTISSDPRVNPSVPDSIGALLTEEWTVNLRSTLPSFLERMLMEEVRRSSWETLRSSFGILEERISGMVMNGESQEINQTDVDGGVREIRRMYGTLLRRWINGVAKAFHQKVLRPFDPEIRFLLMYAAERVSLMYSKSSISEAMYGGKRVKLGEINTSNQYARTLRPIEKQDTVRLSFCLALGPYFEERSQSFFQYFLKLCSSSSDGRASTATSTRKRTLQSILNIFWPLLRMTTKGTFLWYRWQYLLGRSVFFDPYSSLLNLVVRRTTVEDQRESENKPKTTKGGSTDVVNPDNIQMANFRKNAYEFIKSGRIRWAAGGLASFFIAFAWVARIRSIRRELQQERELHELRQVQQQRQQRRQSAQEGNGADVDDTHLVFTKDTQNILIPSPPLSCRKSKKASIKSSENSSDRNFAVCPLCDEPRINPTASTGGYVFCLKCILSCLRQNGEVCPVTRKPCPESSLVRLYEPTHRT